MRKFLCYPIYDRSPTGNYGSERGTCFVYFGKAIKFGGGDCTGGVELFVLLGAEAS